MQCVRATCKKGGGKLLDYQSFRKYRKLGRFKGIKPLNIVGDYAPLGSVLLSHHALSGTNDALAAFEDIYEEAQSEDALLIVAIDEFGKVLEYAAKNNPEKEMYFLQKFCEFVNDSNRNVLFLTTLHQSFNAYAKHLSLEQRQEWTKVKGRIQDVIFNEPTEQLLNLTAAKLIRRAHHTQTEAPRKLYNLALSSKFATDSLHPDVILALYPMDVFAAYILIQANRRYGQNERTLLSFLTSNDEFSVSQFKDDVAPMYNITHVYDYITNSFSSFLSEAHRDSVNWEAIHVALERVTGLNMPNSKIDNAVKVVKVLGLFTLFASAGMILDKAFLRLYFSLAIGINDISDTIDTLEKKNIIRYAQYKSKYILYEGSDVNIEQGLLRALVECHHSNDYVDRLFNYFDAKPILANSHYYRTGTARFFDYRISTTPIGKVALGELDGYINLLFPASDCLAEVKRTCLQQTNMPIIYCLFRNTERIVKHLQQIDRPEWVKDYYVTDKSDRVALQEIENLKRHEQEVLSKTIRESMFSADAIWIFNGSTREGLTGLKELTKQLSVVADTIFPQTPIFKNEMVNKFKPSSAMSLARQNYFEALLKHWDKEDLGFAKNKFPPEKSVFLAMLKQTGMHVPSEDGSRYTLVPPTEQSFSVLWSVCSDFIQSTDGRPRKLSELESLLLAPPFGMKQGFIDWWLPTFLVIRQNDFALYFDGAYVPEINSEILGLMQRRLGNFKIKAFSMNGVKQEFFDRYRYVINLHTTELKNATLIETIRPFLTFYNQLNEYAKRTNDVSTEAKGFRDAIARATDPEETFFETLPTQLGFNELIISRDPAAINGFVKALRTAIRDLRVCYEELLLAIEKKILSSLQIDTLEYPDYKSIIDKRYRYVRAELMPLDVRTFHSRIVGQFANRTAWIESVCYVVLNKPLEKVRDGEKPYLMTALQEKLFQLDDYVEMHRADDENVVRLHITRNNDAPIAKQVILSNAQNTTVKSLATRIEALLTSDHSVNVTALIQVIQRNIE